MAKYTEGKLEIFTETATDSKTFIAGGDSGEIANCHMAWRTNEECEANTERIVSSWNACLNLENPEQAIPKLVEALRTAETRIHNEIRHHPEAGGYREMLQGELRQITEALALVKEA